MKEKKIQEEEIAEVRKKLEHANKLEEVADLMALAGNSTRLKLLLCLMDKTQELSVSELAELLEVSVSAVSQHLSKLKAYGLVKPRRDAQTIYYSVTNHDFNENLREIVLRGPTQPPDPPWPKPWPDESGD